MDELAAALDKLWEARSVLERAGFPESRQVFDGLVQIKVGLRL